MDMKPLGRPGTFHGKVNEWKDWAFGLMSFCTAVSLYMGERMKSYAKSDVGIVHRDKAIERIRNFPDPRHGLDSWRLLVREFEPSHAGRFGGMLVGILATKFKGVSAEELDSWESDIKRYQDSSLEKISDNIKIASVMNNLADGLLLQHLQLN